MKQTLLKQITALSLVPHTGEFSMGGKTRQEWIDNAKFYAQEPGSPERLRLMTDADHEDRLERLIKETASHQGEYQLMMAVQREPIPETPESPRKLGYAILKVWSGDLDNLSGKYELHPDKASTETVCWVRPLPQ